MTQILYGLQMPYSEKPHVFPEAIYDVAVRNTCGFSTFTFKDGRYLWPFIRRRFHHDLCFGSFFISGSSSESTSPISDLYSA